MFTTRRPPPKILVIDVGGSNVKLLMARGARRRFRSGRGMTPKKFMTAVSEFTSDWNYDAISIGFPAPVLNGRPSIEPNNLGKGWKNFDFASAFKKPTRLINDAAMQALGSYEGGRMLFLGLGTGLGSALVIDKVVVPLELGELNYSRVLTLEDVIGKAGHKRLGPAKWERAVHEIVEILRKAFLPDYVILGGGLAKKLEKLPKTARKGNNANAYLGGKRLWLGDRR